MAKNELLPFANGEDANVLPTQQWEALTDILENGFQSGIARSEQVNRVLAQGAVASYVLGQLIVDQLNKDATLDKDTLYQNLILALQENAKDACLPLSGGTLTGNLVMHNGCIIENDVNTGWTRIYGGDDLITGGRIQIAGKDCSGYEGQVWIVPNDGTNAPAFKLFPDGDATWNGRKVVCVESWVSDRNWYRKYSDGWIEQGGFVAKGNKTITLFKAMKDTNYAILMTCKLTSGERWGAGVNNAVSITTTSFGLTSQTSNSYHGMWWQVSGYCA